MTDGVEKLAPGVLLVRGSAVGWFATMAERGVNGQRLNGVRNPLFEGWARTTADAARPAPTSVGGSAEVPVGAHLSASGLFDPVTTSEAAEIMKCSTRNVVDLCRRGALASARKVGAQWQMERAEIEARVEPVTL